MESNIDESDNGNIHVKEPNIESIKGFEKSEKSIVNEQNGSIHLELSSYKAVRQPIYLMFTAICLYPYLCTIKPDPRMHDVPLLDSPKTIVAVSFTYIFFSLVWGPRLMKNRPPIRLKRIIMVYNLIQIFICSYVFIQAGRSAWFWDYNYTCQPVDPSHEGRPFQYTRIVYLYFLTKIFDLLDTVFFVLNKKWTHITFLHVIHHAGLVLGSWIAATYIPGGHGTFFVLLNSLVHALMYTYYFLAALGPSVKPFLWWKKYLTMIQLIQFVIIFLHALQVFFNGCQIQKTFQFFECIYAVMFFYLFMDFYRNSYQKKPKETEKVLTNEIKEVKSN